MQLNRIGVDDVHEWRATMHETVEAGEWAPKTINNARVARLGCFRMAVADRLMAHNPVLDVKPLPIDFSERPYLRIGQINGYVDGCAAHYRPLASFLLGTGARISEAIAVTVTDLDLDAGAVRIHRQRSREETLATRPTKGRNFREPLAEAQLGTSFRARGSARWRCGQHRAARRRARELPVLE